LEVHYGRMKHPRMPCSDRVCKLCSVDSGRFYVPDLGPHVKDLLHFMLSLCRNQIQVSQCFSLCSWSEEFGGFWRGCSTDTIRWVWAHSLWQSSLKGQRAGTVVQPPGSLPPSQVHPYGKPGCELQVARDMPLRPPHDDEVTADVPCPSRRTPYINACPSRPTAFYNVEATRMHGRDTKNPRMKNLEHTHYLPVLAHAAVVQPQG
jgi:hypothetical protein